MDEPDDLHPRRETLDLSNEHYWTQTEHYTGLTPLGVCEWLRINPEIEWPTTYEGLRHMGLGAWVVDWLELAVAQDGGGNYPEAEVVRTFLALLAESEMRSALEKGTGFMGVLRTSLQKMRAMWAGSSDLRPKQSDNEELFKVIATGLTTMTSSTWPEKVLFLQIDA